MVELARMAGLPTSIPRLDHIMFHTCSTPKLVPYHASPDGTSDIDVASQGQIATVQISVVSEPLHNSQDSSAILTPKGEEQ